MSIDTLEIRRIKREELPLIRDLAPPDWNLDLEKMYGQHYSQSYFYPTVTMLGGEIAGTGIANIHSNCAWIGTIIVKEAYRNKGIGAAITHHLIDHSRERGQEAVILSASHAGLPIYAKMGFVTDSQYVFFKPGGGAGGPVMPPTAEKDQQVICEMNETDRQLISPITEKDHPAILELDRLVSGEDRKDLLLHTMGTGFKYADSQENADGQENADSRENADGRIKGYYLPDFGKGLVIADTDEAGRGLLKYKIARERSMVCVPEANAAAIELLVSLGYRAYLTATRMFLHGNVQWDPKKVYARGSGALG